MSQNKILYIGHFNEGSGWSRASTDLALACNYAGIDVVCRSVILNKDNGCHPAIQELCNKNTVGCTHVIQHVLPDFYEYNRGCGKNIGYFVGEGSSFVDCGWQYRCNLLDEIWVPNQQLKNSLQICKPIKIVHHAHDISRYSGRFNNMINDNTYKFYTIIDFVNRKNLLALLKAYHIEFNNNENVSLVVKLSHSNMDSKQVSQSFTKLNNAVCTQLRKYKSLQAYNKITAITDRIPEENIRALHHECDCYISLSHDEAWNYPLADAVFNGNETIASACGGHLEYIPKSSGILVGGSWEPAEGFDSLPNYQTCKSNWLVPSINEARLALRQKFNESQKTPGFIELRRQKSIRNRKLVNDYCYDKIGNQIKDML